MAAFACSGGTGEEVEPRSAATVLGRTIDEAMDDLAEKRAEGPRAVDFRLEGEDFLETSLEVADVVGRPVNDARCERPSSEEPGSTYVCTARTLDGDDWEFTIEITGRREFAVHAGRAVPSP
jgi:hypothetical protein